MTRSDTHIHGNGVRANGPPELHGRFRAGAAGLCLQPRRCPRPTCCGWPPPDRTRSPSLARPPIAGRPGRTTGMRGPPGRSGDHGSDPVCRPPNRPASCFRWLSHAGKNRGNAGARAPDPTGSTTANDWTGRAGTSVGPACILNFGTNRGSAPLPFEVRAGIIKLRGQSLAIPRRDGIGWPGSRGCNEATRDRSRDGTTAMTSTKRAEANRRNAATTRPGPGHSAVRRARG